MKKYTIIIAIALVFITLVSCNQKELEQQQETISMLEQENEALKNEAIEKENNINEFFESMNQIRDNLTQIKLKQDIISEETRDKDNIQQNTREQIEADLAIIGELMEDNRRRINNLNRQLRDSNVKVEQFETVIASLKSDIEEKNVEISLMRDNMNNLNISNTQLSAAIDSLEQQNLEINQIVEQKTEELNTAWYVYGTESELREQSIIEKTGGVLGLGKTTVVNSNVSKDYFTRVDISSIEKVFIPGKNPSLLSLHPKDSYVLETNEEEASMLFIEDPAKFWSNTRYLIVSIQ